MRRIPGAAVQMVITAPVKKLCPVKDEVDEGEVIISYSTQGNAFELHDLAAYFAAFADQKMSHEDFTERVARDLPGTTVESHWTTAGMTVAVFR